MISSAREFLLLLGLLASATTFRCREKIVHSLCNRWLGRSRSDILPRSRQGERASEKVAVQPFEPSRSASERFDGKGGDGAVV